ncbi:hypothetical protein NQD34_016724 [Periophthalmus magnuspinnatus]|nr:hypothetical protein NQD34_016724 [Periophthalmus magnuspinnatus]
MDYLTRVVKLIFRETSCHLSNSCPAPVHFCVLHLSSTYPPPAGHMPSPVSCTCPAPIQFRVLHLYSSVSCTCPAPCLAPGLNLSSSCPAPVQYLSSTCPAPVLHLSFTLPCARDTLPGKTQRTIQA